LYVLEGSRLGAAVLLRRLAPDFPNAFLSALHHAGEWQGLLTKIEQQASSGEKGLIDALISRARLCFEHYVTAASHEGEWSWAPCQAASRRQTPEVVIAHQVFEQGRCAILTAH